MSRDTDIDMKDVELNDVDQERQPMAAGNGEAGSPVHDLNGAVKLKIPEEKETKFTGLSKEELLQVAGSPGWVRARWVLLILFWLGWIGMLAGAIVLIVQAPRCKPLPEMNWWDNGPLYQIGDVKAFTDNAGLSGLELKIEKLAELKVKGVIIGPIHVPNPDKPEDLKLTEIAPGVGTASELKNLIQNAHRKSISVVLDLTPNDTNLSRTAEKVKSATDFWLNKGVDGILLHDIQRLAVEAPLVFSELKDIVKNHSNEKALIGVTNVADPVIVGNMINTTGVDLLLSGVLRRKTSQAVAEAVKHLYSQQGTKQAWNFGDRLEGHLASIEDPKFLKFSQLLLLTLPGTPVFNYGDEIGLQDVDSVYPKMIWEMGKNQTGKEEMQSSRNFFKTVSDLRGKERSLLHGEYESLHISDTSFAYLRVWDQSERYISAFNWSPDSVTLELTGSMLPEKAIVVVSTTDSPAKDESVDLSSLILKPHQAILLKFPYVG